MLRPVPVVAVAARDYFKQVGYMIRKAGQNKYSL